MYYAYMHIICMSTHRLSNPEYYVPVLMRSKLSGENELIPLYSFYISTNFTKQMESLAQKAAYHRQAAAASSSSSSSSSRSFCKLYPI